MNGGIKKHVSSTKFPERLKSLRENRGISQRELRDQLGFSANAITGYESGKVLPRADNLVLIAEYFGVSCDYLLGYTVPRERKEVQTLTESLEKSSERSKRVRELVEEIMVLEREADRNGEEQRD